MNDPWGSFQGFMNNFQQMMQNPSQYVMQRMGISQDKAQNPDAILQDLMSSGKLTQQDYNRARQAAMRIQNNPMFKSMMGGLKR